MSPIDRVLGWLLRRSLAPDEREYVIGDLEEGRARAGRAWHRAQVLRSLAPNVIRRLNTRRARAPKGDSMIATIVQDVRYAVRALRKAPGVTLSAALSLALGIGATTAVFSAINGVMLQPLTYPDAERIMLLFERTAAGEPMSVAFPNYQDWVRDQRVFRALGIYRMSTANLTGADRPERLQVAYGSSGMFAAAGIEPRLGRRFTPAEDLPGASRLAVISERLWHNRFGGDPAVVGRDLTLNGEHVTVVGVMPGGMRFPSRNVDVWLPFGAIVSTLPPSRGAHPNLWVIGRLRDGVDQRQAQAEMDGIAARLGTQYPETNRGGRIAVDSFYEQVVRNIRPALFVLLAVVSCVLLIACGNVANLLLARGEKRRREIAVRAALGATRPRIVQQLLTEHLLLAAGAGVAGLGIAYGSIRVLVAAAPSFVPRLDEITIDPSVLTFTALASVVTGVLIGTLPALRASSSRLGASVKDVGRGRSRSAAALQSGLVVGQVAIAMVLLASAGLLLRSFTSLMAVDLGFQATNVVTMRIDLPTAKYPELPRWTAFHDQLLDAVRRLPAIEAAGVTSAVPLGGSGSESQILPEGRPMPRVGEPWQGCTFLTVSGEYFAVMGMPLLKGRTFTSGDREGSTQVAVIDDRMAALFFPDQDPIGKRVAFEFTGDDAASAQPLWREVVGVVPHVQFYSVATPSPRAQIYVPHTQIPTYNRGARRPGLLLVARSTLPAESLAAGVREAVARLDADLPVHSVNTMSAVVDRQIEQPRFTAALVGTFSVVALLLAAIGIYGVLSYSVSTRTQEMGVRMALGASSRDILRMVLRQGLLLTVFGTIAGAAAAVAAGRLLRDQLFGVPPIDPVGLASVAGILVAVAAAATYIPARRSTRIDPTIALRAD